MMKKSILLAAILTIANYCFGQVKSGYYIGDLVEEYVWSRTIDDYKFLESLPMKTEIILSPKHIYFKKGENATWLKNKWTFDQTIEKENGAKYDRYYDKLEQMIMIDYASRELLYYYNWDKHTEKFSNLAIYKNLEISTSADSDSSVQQELFAKIIITDSSKNGEDNTPIILDQGAFLVFYSFQEDGLIHMANVWPKNKSQSFGPLHPTQPSEVNMPYEIYRADIFYYDWSYGNSYDEEEGTAKVQIAKVYKPQGTAYVVKILAENSDTIILKGNMEGAFEFAHYKTFL